MKREEKRDASLRQMEKDLSELSADRDIRAQQATQKIVMQMQRLIEVLIYGEPKTQTAAKHHA